MTPQEYKSWQEQTSQAFGHWKLDELTFFNRGILRYYRSTRHSGEAGSFVEVNPDGTAVIGSYSGAIPHIGEAMFTPLYTSKLGDDLATAASVAVSRLNEWLPEKIPTQLPLLPGVAPETKSINRKSRNNKGDL